MGVAEGAGSFAILAEDVLNGVLGAVVLVAELETALFFAFVLADDVEFGVDGEFALGAELLLGSCVLSLMVDGTGCAFRLKFGQNGAPGLSAGFGLFLSVMVLKKMRLKPHKTSPVGYKEGIHGARRWRDPSLLLNGLHNLGGLAFPFSIFSMKYWFPVREF